MFTIVKECKHLTRKITPKSTKKCLKNDINNFILKEELESPTPPKKAKHEPVVKKGKTQNVDNDDEKDIDSVNDESKEEQYNKELTYIILKLKNIIKQNEILQEAIKELKNENVLLNNRIDILEKIIGRNEYNSPVSEEFTRESEEQKLNNGFSHNWCK